MKIQADEAILWLRAYAAETAAFGNEAAELSDEMLRLLNTAMSLGGWTQWKNDHPDTYQTAWPRWLTMCERQKWLRETLAARDAA